MVERFAYVCRLWICQNSLTCFQTTNHCLVLLNERITQVDLCRRWSDIIATRLSVDNWLWVCRLCVVSMEIMASHAAQQTHTHPTSRTHHAMEGTRRIGGRGSMRLLCMCATFNTCYLTTWVALTDGLLQSSFAWNIHVYQMCIRLMSTTYLLKDIMCMLTVTY